MECAHEIKEKRKKIIMRLTVCWCATVPEQLSDHGGYGEYISPKNAQSTKAANKLPRKLGKSQRI